MLQPFLYKRNTCFPGIKPGQGILRPGYSQGDFHLLFLGNILCDAHHVARFPRTVIPEDGKRNAPPVLPVLIHKFACGGPFPPVNGPEHLKKRIMIFRRRIFPGKGFRHIDANRRFPAIEFSGALRQRPYTADRIIIKLIYGCMLQGKAEELIPGLQLLLQQPVLLLDFLTSVNIQKYALHHQLIVQIPDKLSASDNPAFSSVPALYAVFIKELIPGFLQFVNSLNDPLPVFLTNGGRKIPFLLLPEFLFLISQNPYGFFVGIFKPRQPVIHHGILDNAAEHRLKKIVIPLLLPFCFLQLLSLHKVCLSQPHQFRDILMIPSDTVNLPFPFIDLAAASDKNFSHLRMVPVVLHLRQFSRFQHSVRVILDRFLVARLNPLLEKGKLLLWSKLHMLRSQQDVHLLIRIHPKLSRLIIHFHDPHANPAGLQYFLQPVGLIELIFQPVPVIHCPSPFPTVSVLQQTF